MLKIEDLQKSFGGVRAVNRCSLKVKQGSIVSITIRPVFVPKRCYSRSVKDKRERMVRPFVKIALKQYKELNTLTKEKKESLSKLIREALFHFTKKKEYSISILPSFLPASTKDQYKTVTAYFLQLDWNLLERISKNTGRCKTELLREAVKEYFKNVKSSQQATTQGWWLASAVLSLPQHRALTTLYGAGNVLYTF